MKYTITVLVIFVIFGILILKYFGGRGNSFVRLDECFNIPAESIISVKISHNDFKRILEKEITSPSTFLIEFAEIVKEHNTKIKENVIASTVYTDEITINSGGGIYRFKFEHPLPGKGLIEYTIENESQPQILIEIDNEGSEKIRALLDKQLDLSTDYKEEAKTM